VRRSNCKNIAKGLRRLDSLLAGELDKTRDLICALPTALEVSPQAVECAIEETRRQIVHTKEVARQAREAAWRAAFKPHAIIVTERTVPQPIFVAAIIGVERLLRIDFNLAPPSVSYTDQAFAGIRQKLAEFRSESGRSSETLPCFGRPVGVIVNCTPDRAVRFDLDGNELEILSRPHRLGEAYIGLCGRLTAPETL
jgi:hypothetical protein